MRHPVMVLKRLIYLTCLGLLWVPLAWGQELPGSLYSPLSNPATQPPLLRESTQGGLSTGTIARDAAQADDEESSPGLDKPEPPDLSPVELTSVPALPSAPPHRSPLPPFIATTRASFTDSWVTVPGGSFQVENGATYLDNRGGSQNWGVAETLFKLGLTDHTELRLGTPSYNVNWGNTRLRPNYWSNVSVAASHHWTLPGQVDLAVIPLLNLPTGSSPTSDAGNSLDPELRVVVARNITSHTVLASQLDARWTTGKNPLARVLLNPTLIGYYSFNEKFTGYLEYAGFFPNAGGTMQYVQSGLLFYPTRRQQWDVRVATGLNGNSANVLVGFGYSFRLDGLFGTSRAFSSFK